MAVLNWKVSKEDRKLIMEIAKRAVDLYGANGVELDQLDVEMDITAVHNHGNPLRLKELLEADNFNLSHDVGGIIRHIDRDTGKLKDFFVPRFTKQGAHHE
jgi:hypothetical protein